MYTKLLEGSCGNAVTFPSFQFSRQMNHKLSVDQKVLTTQKGWNLIENMY